MDKYMAKKSLIVVCVVLLQLVLTSCGDSQVTSSSITPTPPHVSIPIGTTLLTYKRHTSDIQAISWSPDGKRIATVGNDGNLQVWDAMNGLTYIAQRGADLTVAWSPDGKRIAYGGFSEVNIVDAMTGSHILTYQGQSKVDFFRIVVWSPDGKRIAVGSNEKTVQVFDAFTGTHILTYTGHSGWVNSVAWSPDGKSIVSADIVFDHNGANTAQVWDANTGENKITYKGHSRWINSFAWSPDGKKIASGSADKTVKVWQAV
jgi:WD40 repeat protein